jgi:hypothetical protein
VHHLLQGVEVVWAKPVKDHFSALVRSQMDQDLAGLFGMLDCGAATTAPAAMKERVTFVMCALDAYQQTTTWSTCLKAFLASSPVLFTTASPSTPPGPLLHCLLNCHTRMPSAKRIGHFWFS